MQSQILHLALRPGPIAGEFTAGYLIRVAAANGYDGPRALVRALRREQGDFKSQLAAALLLSDADLVSLFGPYPGYCRVLNSSLAGLHSEDFNHYHLRWCPLCLSEANYLRGEWGLKLNCACPIHGVELSEKCIQCGALQRLERTNLRSCACGSQLTAVEALPASPAMLRLHRMLSAAMPHRHAQEPVAIDLPTWLRLVKYLGAFEDTPLVPHPGQVRKLHQLPVAKALTTGTSVLLSDWPTNFDRLLSRIREQLPDATHISEAFGPLYRVLYRHLNDPSLRFIQDAFEAYLHKNWFGLLGRRNRRLRIETITSHPHKPVGLVAQVAGVPKATIRRLAETGAIEAEAIHCPSGRTTWSVHVDSAHIASRYTKDYTTMLVASRQLGLPKYRLRELIEAGLIGAAERSSQNPWKLCNTDLEKLRHFLDSVEPMNYLNDKHVTLAVVLKSRRLHGQEFPDLIRDVLSREIAVHGSPSQNARFLDLEFRAKDIKRWLDKYRGKREVWLSVSAAAKSLGLKQQVAYELVSQGLLKVSETIKNGNVFRRVHLKAIEEFSVTYISLTELAHRQRKAPRAMLRLIAATPVCGPNIDHSRQYFYQRREVEHLLALANVGK